MMKSDFVISKIGVHDHRLIDNLNDKLYKGFPKLDSYSKLNTFYAPHKDLGVIAKSGDGVLVGTYLVYPVLVNLEGRLLWVCQSGNSMVDNAYLGQNLVYLLGMEVYSQLSALNYLAAYGIPSKSILRTRLKLLNWRQHCVINGYTIILPTIPLFLLARRFNSVDKWHKRYTKLLGKVFFESGDFFNSSDKFAGDDRSYVERTVDYWQYKLQGTDVFLYKEGKTSFVLKFNQGIYLGDIDFSGGRPSFYFILKLCFFLILSFNVSIRTYCTEGSFLENFLKLFVKPKPGLSFCSRVFDEKLNISKFKFTYFDFDTF